MVQYSGGAIASLFMESLALPCTILTGPFTGAMSQNTTETAWRPGSASHTRLGKQNAVLRIILRMGRTGTSPANECVFDPNKV